MLCFLDDLFDLLRRISDVLDGLGYLVLLSVRWWDIHRLHWFVFKFGWGSRRLHFVVLYGTWLQIILWYRYRHLNFIILSRILWCVRIPLLFRRVRVRKVLVLDTYRHEVFNRDIADSHPVRCGRLCILKVLLTRYFSLFIRVRRCWCIHIIHDRPALSFLLVDLKSVLVLQDLLPQVIWLLLLDGWSNVFVVLGCGRPILVIFGQLLQLITIILLLDIGRSWLVWRYGLLFLLLINLVNHLREVELRLCVIWLATIVVTTFLLVAGDIWLVVYINLLALELEVCLDNTLNSAHVRAAVHMESLHELSNVVGVLPLFDSFEEAQVNQSDRRCTTYTTTTVDIHI